MSVVINGTTGITDADGGTVLSTADLASQAQAEAGTDNTVLMTPLRTSEAITALAGGTASAEAFTAPGTWTKPASVKFVKVTVVGGGAPGVTNPGGPGTLCSSGGGGGGTGIKYIPGPSIPGPVAVTRGAVSSTSSFGAFVSATGGSNTGPLAGGTATGADIGIPGTAGGFGTPSGGIIGHGGPSAFGGGGAGNQSAGGGYGGGGAGVVTVGTGPSPAPSAPGGAGAAGVVIVEVFE
jgi:hypothetical protein